MRLQGSGCVSRPRRLTAVVICLVVVGPPWEYKYSFSYRRSDAPAATGRIWDKLAHSFGGQQRLQGRWFDFARGDFDKTIEDALNSSDVFLLIIGPTWLTALDEDGNQRISNPEDYVRRELLAARRSGIRIIPLVVDVQRCLRQRTYAET